MKLKKSIGLILSIIISIVFVVVLLVTETVPFSVFKADSDVASSEETDTESQEKGTSSDDGGDEEVEDSELNQGAIQFPSTTSIQKIVKNNEDLSPTITVVNQSGTPYIIYVLLDSTGDLNRCNGSEEEKNCVSSPELIKIAEYDKSEIELTFTKLDFNENNPVLGQIIIVGEGLYQVIPVSIQLKKGKLFDLEAYQPLGEWILKVILVILTSFVIFIIIWWHFLPSLCPKTFGALNLEREGNVDKNNKADNNTKQIGQLQEVFASELNRIQTSNLNFVCPRFLQNKVDLPAHFSEDSKIKIILDLIQWLLPRRGMTVRMESLSSKKLGVGLTVSMLKNENREVIASETFWSKKFYLSNFENTSSENGKEETKSDEDLIRRLMTPVVIWTIKQYYSYVNKTFNIFGVDEESWISLAYSMLGSSMDLDEKTRYRLLMDAILTCPKNRLAQSTLGRYWLEKSQKDRSEKTKYIKNAQGYLSQVVDYSKDAKKKDKERETLFYAALYNLSVSYVYLDQIKKAIELSKELVDEINSEIGKNQNIRNWLEDLKPMAQILYSSADMENSTYNTFSELEDKVKKEISNLSTAIQQNSTNNELEEHLLYGLHYRAQYNVACFLSTAYRIAKKHFPQDKKKAIRFGKLSLQYLELSVGHMGGLTQYAREDQSLDPVNEDFKKEFDKIAPEKKEEESESKLIIFPVIPFMEIEVLPGISDDVVQKLRNLSILTWSDLLVNGIDPENRKELVNKINIPMKQLIWWLNLCDLTRIPGLSLDNAVLLESMGGVDTVKELRNRNAKNLMEKLDNRISEDVLADWIKTAGNIIPSIKYK